MCLIFFLHLLILLYDFYPYFPNVVYHIDPFAYVKPSLHPWNESHLMVMYDLFDALLYLIC